jgi:hypothetical protein
MDIKLVSQDAELNEFCRETLADIPGHLWTLSATTRDEVNGGADLYIWDVCPDSPLPPMSIGLPRRICSWFIGRIWPLSEKLRNPPSFTSCSNRLFAALYRSGNQMIPPDAERRRHMIQNANSYRIDIKDSGAPIPQEHLERIFEEYTSYSGGRDRSGGGLGLSICRMIINQHDGRVWAENTDAGPMFSFALPTIRSQPHSCGENENKLHFGGLTVIHADI